MKINTPPLSKNTARHSSATASARGRSAESFARRGRGGNRRGKPQFWKTGRTDLQHPGRIAQLVNLIEHHDRLRAAAKKHLRIAHHVLDGGQVAIAVERPFRAEGFGQRRLATATDTAQPRDGSFAPFRPHSLLPERPFDHPSAVYAPVFRL